MNSLNVCVVFVRGLDGVQHVDAIETLAKWWQHISLSNEGDLPQTRLAGDCLSWLQSVTLLYLDLHNDLGLHLYCRCQ